MCMPIPGTGLCLPPPTCPICNGSMISQLHTLWFMFWGMVTSTASIIIFKTKENIKIIRQKIALITLNLISKIIKRKIEII